MKKRPNAETNGKVHLNGKGSYSWLDTGRRRYPRVSLKQSQALIPLTFLCIALGLSITVFYYQDNRLPNPSPSAAIPRAEAFRRAVNRAMSAAELTQTAASREEWRTVAMWWQEAIDLMKMVPITNEKHQIAQDRIGEYGRNLEYAQKRALGDSTAQASVGLWTIGSHRGEVIKIQGEPSKSDRYDSMCKEVLFYGNSTVELNNGSVARFEDVDKNLKATDQPNQVIDPHADASYWTIGSTRDKLFRMQGTPSRVVRYDYSKRELLYYGNNTVDLMDGKVTGYSNYDGTLRVFTPAVGTTGNDKAWSLDSTREDVFRIQGTPTQVVLDDAACSEVLTYGDSTIQVTNGFITGYDNLSNNLRVRVK